MRLPADRRAALVGGEGSAAAPRPGPAWPGPALGCGAVRPRRGPAREACVAGGAEGLGRRGKGGRAERRRRRRLGAPGVGGEVVAGGNGHSGALAEFPAVPFPGAGVGEPAPGAAPLPGRLPLLLLAGSGCGPGSGALAPWLLGPGVGSASPRTCFSARVV